VAGAGMSTQEGHGKLVPLEALRGCAAIIVVLHHFVLAFLPRYIGLTPSVDPARDLIGSPLYVLLNGTAMVILFFVLSGYVLAQKGLRDGASRALLDAAIKRWFRLTPLILVSVLISWALFHTGLYLFDDAAAFSGSEWLSRFSYGNLGQGDRPALLFAVREGLWGVLFNGDYALNSSLWTMRFEFIGSFVVFGLALFLRTPYRAVVPIMLVVAGVVLIRFSPWLFPFVLGVAACLLPLRHRELPPWATGLLAVAGLYLAGFAIPSATNQPAGAYAWVNDLPMFGRPATTPVRMVVVCGAGAWLLLILFATDNAVSRRFSGRWAKAVGAASFPLYVLHVLIIDSFSSWAYAALGGGWIGLVVAALVLVVTLVPLVWLLSMVDRWWVGTLRRWRLWELPGNTAMVGFADGRVTGSDRLAPTAGRGTPPRHDLLL
jgi:peptidoglycan/LPS O-acetylase OafA/YrhL